MTENRRHEIMSKEALSIKDIQELYDVSAATACRLMQKWKFRAGDRLNVRGKIHIIDYQKAIRSSEDHEQTVRGYRTVCLSK